MASESNHPSGGLTRPSRRDPDPLVLESGPALRTTQGSHPRPALTLAAQTLSTMGRGPGAGWRPT